MGQAKGPDPRLQREGSGERRPELIAALKQAGLAPRKELGQHFLASPGIVAKIIEAAGEFAGCLEIGPGPGVLTRGLAERGRVIALELDERMAAFASEWAAPAEIRRQDALRADWAEVLAELPEPRVIVSNLPYQITGLLLARCAEARDGCRRAVFMMQKEVGEKIAAEPGDRRRGAVSVAMQRQFSIRRVCWAPPGAFWPPPKVDSVVLAFAPRPREAGEADLLALVRKGFTQPRKTLANNLECKPGALAAAGLEPSCRPHQLSEVDWLRLAEALR